MVTSPESKKKVMGNNSIMIEETKFNPLKYKHNI